MQPLPGDPPATPTPWRGELPGLALALVVSLGLALWALDPTWREPGRWLVGNWNHPDCLSNHWLLHWVAERVSQGESFLHNDAYYWPIGDDPVRSGNGAEGFAFLPFALLLGGWPLAVPAYLLAILTLNGLSGWLLGRAAGAGAGAALLPLAMTGAAPYVFRELSAGRFTQVSICWLGFFLASWLWFLGRPSRRRALLAALLLAVTAFFYWFYGLFGVLAGALLLLARGRRAPGPGPLALFSLAFLVLIGPWGVVFASGWSQIPGVSEASAFPHPEALLDAAWPQLPVTVRDGRYVGQAMGWGTLLVGLSGIALGLARIRRDPVSRGLIAVLLAFTLLMVGPVAALGPVAPYSLLYGLAEPLRRFWWPSRHVVVVHLALGALGALALQALVDRLRARLALGRNPGTPATALGLVLGLLLVVAQPLSLIAQGVPTHPRLTPMGPAPQGYLDLAQLDPGVLIEPPIAPQAAGTQQHLVFQIWHHKPLLSGHALWVDRVRPDAWDTFVGGNSFLAELQRFERGELGDRFAFEGAELQALLDAGVRWFGVNREYFANDLRDLRHAYPDLLRGLFGAPVISDDGLRVWDMGRWNGETEVTVADLSWPASLVPAGPDQPLNDRRPRSMVFAVGDGRTGPLER